MAGSGLGSRAALLAGSCLAEFAVHHGTTTAAVGEEDAEEHHNGGCQEDGTQNVFKLVRPGGCGSARVSSAGYAGGGEPSKVGTERRVGRRASFSVGDEVASERVVGILSGRGVVG